MMKTIALLLAAVLYSQVAAEETSKELLTPYGEQKVVYDFYLDDPNKINSALFSIRSLINPLMDDPDGVFSDVPEGWSVDGVGLRVVACGDFTVALAGDQAVELI